MPLGARPGNGQHTNRGVRAGVDEAGRGGHPHGPELIKVANGDSTCTGAVLTSLTPSYIKYGGMRHS